MLNKEEDPRDEMFNKMGEKYSKEWERLVDEAILKTCCGEDDAE